MRVLSFDKLRPALAQALAEFVIFGPAFDLAVERKWSPSLEKKFVKGHSAMMNSR